MASSDGVGFNAQDTQAAGALPVVLVHPFPVHAGFLDPLREALIAQGWTVLTPDLPGFGARRGELAEVDEPPSLDYFAIDLGGMLDEAGIDRVIIGGVSLGGYVAMAFLRLFPERVAGIILADTKAALDPDEARAGRLAFADRAEAEGVGWVPDAMQERLLGPVTLASQPETVTWVREAIAAADPGTLAWTQRAMAARPDSRQLLAHFQGPGLVVVGADDVLSPVAEAREIADSMTDAQLQIIPDVGHFAALEDTPTVAATVSDWLTQRALTPPMR